MNYSINEVRTPDDSKTAEMHAGGKARADVCDILFRNGFKEIKVFVDGNRDQVSTISKLNKHQEICNKWIKACDITQTGDSVVIQYPIIDHSLFMGRLGKHLKMKGVQIILLIHDLSLLRPMDGNSIRIRNRLKLEEGVLLKYADMIIVHNNHMKELLENMGVPSEKMISLDIFDYLITEWDYEKASKRTINKNLPVIIAGNLSKEKSGYVYNLPANQRFNLYGVNYDGVTTNNIDYKGAYLPTILPFEMCGSFGLVWDGPESSTCCGVYGNYLKYNNPHKTSLYLASEIPVIIWKRAALADFIINNGLGIAIDSLDEIHNEISNLSNEKYNAILVNVKGVSSRIRHGDYTITAIEKAIETSK